jgi:hypothetical protein
MSWRDRYCYSSLWNIILMVRLFWLMHKINKRDDHISVLFKRLSSQSKLTTMIFITRMLLKGILSTKIVIFSYPKLLSFSVLTFIKWRLTSSYAAKDMIFWQKRPKTIAIRIIVLDDNIQIYSYGLLCEHVLSMHTV